MGTGMQVIGEAQPSLWSGCVGPRRPRKNAASEKEHLNLWEAAVGRQMQSSSCPGPTWVGRQLEAPFQDGWTAAPPLHPHLAPRGWCLDVPESRECGSEPLSSPFIKTQRATLGSIEF